MEINVQKRQKGIKLQRTQAKARRGLEFEGNNFEIEETGYRNVVRD